MSLSFSLKRKIGRLDFHMQKVLCHEANGQSSQKSKEDEHKMSVSDVKSGFEILRIHFRRYALLAAKLRYVSLEALTCVTLGFQLHCSKISSLLAIRYMYELQPFGLCYANVSRASFSLIEYLSQQPIIIQHVLRYFYLLKIHIHKVFVLPLYSTKVLVHVPRIE